MNSAHLIIKLIIASVKLHIQILKFYIKNVFQLLVVIFLYDAYSPLNAFLLTIDIQLMYYC